MVKKEELPPEQQERSPYPDQGENESPLIKEEEEELNISQGREQLQGLEEADTKFLITLVDVKSENDDEEKPESSLLHHRLTEQMETAAGGEDCGRAEPARSSDPEIHLPPQNEVKIEASSVTGSIDGADDCEENKEPLQRLKSDPQTVTLQGHPDPEESINVLSLTENNHFSCSVRGKESNNKGNIVEPMAVHSGVKPHSCSVCGKRFYLKLNLMVHMHCHLKKGDQEIPGSSLLHHRLTDHIETAAGAEDCGRAETARSSHPERQLQPEIKVMIASSDTRDPVRGLKSATNIGSETLGSKNCDNLGKKSHRPFICSECGKGFRFKGGLNTHMVVHTRERPYSCSLCGRGFGVKSHLTVHMQGHLRKGDQEKTGSSLLHQRGTSHKNTTAGGSINCEMLEKTSHKVSVRENGSFICSECGKEFLRKAHLRNHMVVHTKEKPFSCSLCGKSFGVKSCLTLHLLRHLRKGDQVPESSLVYQRYIGHKKTAAGEEDCGRQEPARSSDPEGQLQPEIKVMISSSDTGCGSVDGADGWKETKDPVRRFESATNIGSETLGSKNCEMLEKTSHKVSVRENRPFICSECGKGFRFKAHLSRHMIVHTKEKPYSCSLCGKSFGTKSNLTLHLHRHLRRGDQVPELSPLYHRDNSHKKTAAGEEDCGGQEPARSSDPERQLQPEIKVMISSSDTGSGSIDGADGWEKTRDPVRRFESATNTGSETLGSKKCDNLGKKSLRPLICSECGKEFRFKAHLNNHMIVHTKEKSFSCSLCGKRFGFKRNLTAHLHIHLRKGDQVPELSLVYQRENRPFICSECGKEFPRKENLKNHIVVHTKEKPYSCSLCGKRFGIKSYLTVHLHRHLRKGDQVPELSLVYQRDTGHKKTTAVEEDCGRKEPARSSDPERQSQPEIKVMIASSDTGSGSINGADGWEETRDPLRGLKSATNIESETLGSKNCEMLEKTSHKLSVRENRPFICLECGKEFPRKAHLRNHMVVHTKEKPYSCSLCGKRFGVKSNLTAHLHIHLRKGDQVPELSLVYQRDTGHKKTAAAEGDCGRQEPARSSDPEQKLQPEIKVMISSSDTRDPVRGLKSATNIGSETLGSKNCDKLEKTSHKVSVRENRPFICLECGKEFRFKGDLKNHMVVHTKEKPYSCSLCGERFGLKRNLTAHLHRHLRKGDQVPESSLLYQRDTGHDKAAAGGEDCGRPEPEKKKRRKVQPEIEVEIEASLDTGSGAYSCSYCGKAFLLETRLKVHMRIHTNRNPHSCTKCGKRFTRKGSLDNHRFTHTEEKPYFCSVCGKGFIQIGDLATHLRVHITPKRKDCSVRGRGLLQNLITLMRVQGPKRKDCPVCGKVFNHTQSLYGHMVTHTRAKPYNCSICGRGFMRLKSLKNHKLVHPIEKPYSCPDCGKAFHCQRYLTTHKAIHTRGKPYSCSECEKRYGYKESLKAHMRVHAREEPTSAL